MSVINGRERKLLFGANVFFIVCVAAITIALVWSLIHVVHRIDTVLQAVQSTQVESAQQRSDHRVRNELLHECLVELMYDIVESRGENVRSVPNPCEVAQNTAPHIEPE